MCDFPQRNQAPAMNGTRSAIGEARPQTWVIVTGTIRATAAVTVGGSPAFRCQLADGTGEIEMLFLGRAAAVTPDTIEVSVTDHGPGVDASRRDEIFGLFARRDDDAGAGLGLTIAKTFVEAHGQRIWVEDAPGGGARFCFTLPVAAPITEEPQLAARSHH
jgi:signal transduction histidine kinase